MVKREPKDDVLRIAWDLHRANGHPLGYDGPCWGPTMKEFDQAKEESNHADN